MDGLDNATWQALGLVLTLVGLAVSVLLWSRKGPASGVRGVAWSLLPLAAGLTGVLRLGWEVADSVVSWATRLVFSPVVWLGFVVAGVSVVLFVVSGWMRRRGVGGRGTTGSRSVASGQGASTAGQLPQRRSSPAATAGAGSTAGTGGAAAAPKPASGSAGDDMDEIEEILRRHGIQ